MIVADQKVWVQALVGVIMIILSEYCWGNLIKCWGVTCNGLASHPGGREEGLILLVASCYSNQRFKHKYMQINHLALPILIGLKTDLQCNLANLVPRVSEKERPWE